MISFNRSTRLSTLALLSALAACDEHSPTTTKASPKFPGYAGAREEIHKIDYAPDIIVLQRTPITGERLPNGSCSLAKAAAQVVADYAEKHPGKQPGRGAGISARDEEACTGEVAITITPDRQQTPTSVDTTVARTPASRTRAS